MRASNLSFVIESVSPYKIFDLKRAVGFRRLSLFNRSRVSASRPANPTDGLDNAYRYRQQSVLQAQQAARRNGLAQKFQSHLPRSPDAPTQQMLRLPSPEPHAAAGRGSA